MKVHRGILALMVGVYLLPALASGQEGSTPYQALSSHYEAIRLALLGDSLDGVAEHARAIRESAAGLRKELSAERAGVSAVDLDQCAEALTEIAASAMRLSTITDLGAARDELFVLTRPLVEYRKLVGDRDTIVAYCPMAQKAWIQPAGQIGNPYFGQEMPKCGEVVGEG